MILFKDGIDISDVEAAILLDTIPDIEEWVMTLLKEKAGNHKERVFRDGVEFLESEGGKLGDSKASTIDKYLKHPKYKSRKERDKDTPI